jgi:hypothetical protein
MVEPPWGYSKVFGKRAKRKPKKQQHADLLKAIDDAMQWDQWSRVPIVAGPFSPEGIWDRYYDKAGRVVWIEAKVHPDRLSPAQVEFGRERRRQGIETYVIQVVEDLRGVGLLEKVQI